MNLGYRIRTLERRAGIGWAGATCSTCGGRGRCALVVADSHESEGVVRSGGCPSCGRASVITRYVLAPAADCADPWAAI